MRCSERFATLLTKNARIKIDSAKEEVIRKTVDDFFATIDAINELGRFDSILENRYAISEYSIVKPLSTLIYPSAVVVVSGSKYTDYLDRASNAYKFTEDGKGEVLSPAEFIEAQLYIYNIMKRSIAIDNDMSMVKREEKSVSTAEADNYAVNGSVTQMNSLWPIPITIDFIMTKYLLLPVDEEFIDEWFLQNFFNITLSSK